MPIFIAVYNKEIPEISFKAIVLKIEGHGSIGYLTEALKVSISVMDLACEDDVSLALKTLHL